MAKIGSVKFWTSEDYQKNDRGWTARFISDSNPLPTTSREPQDDPSPVPAQVNPPPSSER